MLPELYNPVDLLSYVNLTKAKFKRLSDDEVADIFTKAGFIYDTVLKQKDIAIQLYFIGMQAAYQAGWEPHRWATLFERVAIILRKHKNHETELKVLNEITTRFPYLSNYHQWEKRKEKLKQIIEKKSTTKGSSKLLRNTSP